MHRPHRYRNVLTFTFNFIRPISGSGKWHLHAAGVSYTQDASRISHGRGQGLFTFVISSQGRLSDRPHGQGRLLTVQFLRVSALKFGGRLSASAARAATEPPRSTRRGRGACPWSSRERIPKDRTAFFCASRRCPRAAAARYWALLAGFCQSTVNGSTSLRPRCCGPHPDPPFDNFGTRSNLAGFAACLQRTHDTLMRPST